MAIVDYGVGNLRSVAKACEWAGFPAVTTDSPKALREAPGVILPGVGAFGAAMASLERAGLVDAVRAAAEEAAAGGRPFLGLCLGLHLLFEESEESFGGENPRGLGVFPGRVVRFPQAGLKVPQIGWNTAAFRARHPILEGVRDGSYFYFVHSYYAVPADPETILLATEYGTTFTSGVARGNAVAFQFHPEKSSAAGLALLANLGRLVYGEAKTHGLGQEGEQGK